MSNAPASASQLFQSSVSHHQAGRLAEAERGYRGVLSLDPNHADALHYLGVIAHQRGRNDDAVRFIGRSIELNGRNPISHYNIGLALHALGRLDEVIAHNKAAIGLRPDYSEAHMNLGNAYKERGRLDDAAQCFERALRFSPGLAEVHFNLGNVRAEQNRLDEARTCYRRAISLKPYDTGALIGLATTHLRQGDAGSALAFARRAYIIEDNPLVKALLVECIRSLPGNSADGDLREILIRAISEPWCRPAHLASAAAALIKSGQAIGSCLDAVARAWPRRLPAGELFKSVSLREIAHDRLFRHLLEAAPIADLALERLLTTMRAALLDEAMEAGATAAMDPEVLALHCALARQCFINEYVFDHTDEEIGRAARLRDGLLDGGGNDVSLQRLIAVGAYFPLHGLPHAQSLAARMWPAPVAELLAQQIREPQEEERLRPAIPRLTEIGDDVSLRVQEQYEVNPYPRWAGAGAAMKPMTAAEFLRMQCPAATDFRAVGRGRVDVLFAGAGTGQSAIENALLLRDTDILAIDISLASLSYAKRRTAELGLTCIEYGQADILNLGSIGRSFDVIDATGVLHHMADPWQGWRVLLSLLRPGGFMHLGFYSDAARRHIVEVRKIIEQRGIQPSAGEMRKYRTELAAADEGTPQRAVTRFSDFFSMSMCRDLLFHVQEHRMKLPEIKRFLDGNGLDFLGFDLNKATVERYRSRFPDDRSNLDLDGWHQFETENPDTFSAMYQFWVQKRL